MMTIAEWIHGPLRTVPIYEVSRDKRDMEKNEAPERERAPAPRRNKEE